MTITLKSETHALEELSSVPLIYKWVERGGVEISKALGITIETAIDDAKADSHQWQFNGSETHFNESFNDKINNWNLIAAQYEAGTPEYELAIANKNYFQNTVKPLYAKDADMIYGNGMLNRYSRYLDRYKDTPLEEWPKFEDYQVWRDGTFPTAVEAGRTDTNDIKLHTLFIQLIADGQAAVANAVATNNYAIAENFITNRIEAMEDLGFPADYGPYYETKNEAFANMPGPQAAIAHLNGWLTWANYIAEGNDIEVPLSEMLLGRNAESRANIWQVYP